MTYEQRKDVKSENCKRACGDPVHTHEHSKVAVHVQCCNRRPSTLRAPEHLGAIRTPLEVTPPPPLTRVKQSYLPTCLWIPAMCTEDFRAAGPTDTSQCPAGARRTYRCAPVALGRHLRDDATSACKACARKRACTRRQEGRRLTRWVEEDLLEERAQRVRRRPEVMTRRKERVEHPCGTMKRWWDAGDFFMRGQEEGRAECRVAARRRPTGSLPLGAAASGVTRSCAVVRRGSARWGTKPSRALVPPHLRALRHAWAREHPEPPARGTMAPHPRRRAASARALFQEKKDLTGPARSGAPPAAGVMARFPPGMRGPGDTRRVRQGDGWQDQHGLGAMRLGATRH
jgi:hypothetical protein